MPLVRVLQVYSDAEPINIGSGADLTIAELARRIAGLGRLLGRDRLGMPRLPGRVFRVRRVAPAAAL
jgi:hypothetical protein